MGEGDRAEKKIVGGKEIVGKGDSGKKDSGGRR